MKNDFPILKKFFLVYFFYVLKFWLVLLASLFTLKWQRERKGMELHGRGTGNYLGGVGEEKV